MDIRTWLAGCALANPKLIPETTPPVEAARQARRIADALMLALKAPPTPPEIPTMTDEELTAWEDELSMQKHHNDQVTVIEVRGGRDVIPPPPSSPKVASSGSTGSTLPSRRG